MSLALNESEFAKLIEEELPLIDVRAPVEFQRGAFPGAINLPLLSDEERHEVGKRFKNSGQDAAIALANELLSSEIKQQRLDLWQAYIEQHPSALICCFRGGLRSQTVQQWLRELGTNVPLVEGGYKALRQFLMQTIDDASADSRLMIIGGKTGSAKTHLLNALDYSIDLEGLANHRGSAFGRRIQAQPAQSDFENQLALSLLKLPYKDVNQLFLEDESRAIGSLSIPKNFHDKMNASPIAMLEESLENRIETIYNDYIYSNYQDFVALDEDTASSKFAEFLLASLHRIQRRLGGEKFALIESKMKLALDETDSEQAANLHRSWIESLLSDYYDPMYEYQMNKKLNRVVYRGSREEFVSWASHLNGSN